MEQEHRRFRRIRFEARGELCHQGICYLVRVQNLSLHGALLSSHEGILIPAGDRCTLTFEAWAGGPPLIVGVEIKHTFFSMAGVHFLAYDQNTEDRLIALLEGVRDEAGGCAASVAGTQRAVESAARVTKSALPSGDDPAVVPQVMNSRR